MAAGPLSGFRVLDLTSVVSGPFCTMLLGDLGADVIKIEPPGGEVMRNVGRPAKNGVTAAFLNFNRNKRSVVVNLKKTQGRDLVRRLAARCDVLVENYRPGVADRLGIGYADIRRLNSKIVYCSISGFGPSGPLANAPSYDPVVQGYSGMTWVQAGKTGRPTAVKMALADKVSGMTAALSIVSALHAARARGVGQYIRVPMLHAMIAFTANDTFYGHTFVPEDEFKKQAPSTTSLDPFPTSDGWIMLAPFTDAQFERLCDAIGHPEWWRDEPDRTVRLRNILRGLAQLMPQRTTAEWLELMRSADIPCGPVHNYDSLLDDPEIVSNQVFSFNEHSDVGTFRAPNPAPIFSETPMKIWRVPPRLGEHTVEVLRESGLSSEDIRELSKAEVIGEPS